MHILDLTPRALTGVYNTKKDRRTDGCQKSEKKKHDKFRKGWFISVTNLGKAGHTNEHICKSLKGRSIVCFLLPAYPKVAKRSCNSQKGVILIYIELWVIKNYIRVNWQKYDFLSFLFYSSHRDTDDLFSS